MSFLIFCNFNCLYFRYGLELDKFGIDVQVLKDPVFLKEFVGWKEDWENKLKKKNCPVVEARFLLSTRTSLPCFRIVIKYTLLSKVIWSFIKERLGVGYQLGSVLKKALKMKGSAHFLLLHWLESTLKLKA